MRKYVANETKYLVSNFVLFTLLHINKFRILMHIELTIAISIFVKSVSTIFHMGKKSTLFLYIFLKVKTSLIVIAYVDY